MDATRLDTNVGNWAPVARHYQVDGGYIVVVVNQFLTATGTEIFYADETGAAFSMEPIARFPNVTTHDEALGLLGYTVVDNIVEEIVELEPQQIEEIQQSVIDMLPPEIAEVISQATI